LRSIGRHRVPCSFNFYPTFLECNRRLGERERPDATSDVLVLTLLTGDPEILDRDVPCVVEDLRGDRAYAGGGDRVFEPRRAALGTWGPAPSAPALRCAVNPGSSPMN